MNFKLSAIIAVTLLNISCGNANIDDKDNVKSVKIKPFELQEEPELRPASNPLLDMPIEALKKQFLELSDLSDTAEVQEYANILSSKLSPQEFQDLSNALWGGNKVPRNRIASVVLAQIAYNQDQQPWSALRLGIGYLNGVGVVQDTDRAINLLSHAELSDNKAAAYFLGLAYGRNGDVNEEVAQMLRAHELGHPHALKRLQEIEAQ